MINFEQVSLDLKKIEKKTQENCKGTMTTFKGGNIKRRLEITYREASKLKDPEKTKTQTKAKKPNKFVRALLETRAVMDNLNKNCGCMKYNPSNREPRRGIRL